MNDNMRYLLNSVVKGDIRTARSYAKLVLKGITSKQDEVMKQKLLSELESKPAFELSYDLQQLLVVKDSSNFRADRFILREKERKLINKVLTTVKVSTRLAEYNIRYLPTVMLYGQSGCGKTLLAEYIAYRLNLPFVFVKFSNLINSHLGGTQSNLAKIFAFVRQTSCVLCFDEIDTIGLSRGKRDDVGEMSRVTIALMQELDSLQNNNVVIGTTNRYDLLDTALLRRFLIHEKICPLDTRHIRELCTNFFNSVHIDTTSWIDEFISNCFGSEEPASKVTDCCIAKLVEILSGEQDCEKITK